MVGVPLRSEISLLAGEAKRKGIEKQHAGIRMTREL
jgi:hypothetical protein